MIAVVGSQVGAEKTAETVARILRSAGLHDVSSRTARAAEHKQITTDTAALVIVVNGRTREPRED